MPRRTAKRVSRKSIILECVIKYGWSYEDAATLAWFEFDSINKNSPFKIKQDNYTW